MRTAIALGCLCLLAAPVRAADAPADPDLATQGARRAGPFYLRPVLRLKDVGYDDNIRFDAREKEGDTTATAGAGLEALLLTGDRGGLFLSEEADYVTFSRNTDLDHWNGRARARGILLAGPLALSLEDSFASVRERPNVEIDQRLRQRHNAVTAAVRTRRTGRLGMRSYMRHETINFHSDDPSSAAIAERLDRDENALGVVGEVRVLPKTTATLEAAAERVDFADPATVGDNRSLALLPGLRFDPTARLQGEVKAGVKSLKARGRPQQNARVAVGEGSLATRLGRATRARMTFERDLVFSIVGDNLYYVGTEWSAALEQFFSRRLSGEVLYGRGLSHYPEPIVAAAPSAFQGIRDDRLTRYQVSVRYRVNESLAIVATGSHLGRDSTDDSIDRARNVYAFGSTYNF